MSNLELKIIESRSELESLAERWDDLWQRSPLSLPPFRAAQVLLWLDHFAPRGEFRAVVVSEGTRWLAALPLIGTRSVGGYQVAEFPNNFYSTGGELLYDASAASDVATKLAEGLAQLPWKLFTLNFVAFEQPAWQQLVAAIEQRGMCAFVKPSFAIGQVDLRCSFATYNASRSRNHRRSIHRGTDRIDELGGAVLNIVTPTPADDLETLLRRGFDVEDRSWKSAAGTSVLRTPGLFEFYLDQARELAAHGQLKLAFLEHDGKAIAFEYAWSARGTYVSQKVGYDEAFAEVSPSQLLRARLYERFCESGEEQLIDYRGILSEATARWATQSYQVGRVVLGRGLVARSLVGGYRAAWPAYQRLRTRLGRAPQPAFELRPLKKPAQSKKATAKDSDREEVAASAAS